MNHRNVVHCKVDFSKETIVITKDFAKREHADLAAACTRATTYRRFCVR